MTLLNTYEAALFVAILSFLCLGSWANSFKLSRWRFELTFLDFVLGLLLMSVILAFTAGNFGYDSFTFLDDLMHTGKRNLLYGFAAGGILNLGYILLAGGMSLTGMALAFPLWAGMAMAVGSLAELFSRSQASPALVYSGAAALAMSVVMSAATHRSLSLRREFEKMKAGTHRTLRPAIQWKGVVLCVCGGIVAASAAPVMDLAREGELGLGPYALGFLVAFGAFCSTILYDVYFMSLPVKGEPLEPTAYLRGAWKQHLWGVLGGAVWAVGIIGALVIEASPGAASGNAAVFATVGRAFPLLAAAWGILVWKEFRAADMKVASFMAVTLSVFAAGIVLIGIGLSRAGG